MPSPSPSLSHHVALFPFEQVPEHCRQRIHHSWRQAQPSPIHMAKVRQKAVSPQHSRNPIPIPTIPVPISISIPILYFSIAGCRVCRMRFIDWCCWAVMCWRSHCFPSFHWSAIGFGLCICRGFIRSTVSSTNGHFRDGLCNRESRTFRRGGPIS